MNRDRNLWWFGAAVALVVTTTMDATGLAIFSALPLLPLAGLFWWLSRLSRREMGLRWGGLGDHGLALLYPAVVVGLTVGIVCAVGATDTADTDWAEARRHLLLSLTGILGAMITEEAFFRGWLWSALGRAGWTPPRVLIGSSVIFTLWHVSAVTLATGFDLPPHQVPVFLVNATLLGVVWGLLRRRSDSILVAGVSHGVWNGLVYVLFGFGREIGALGVTETILYGPELGFLGWVLNGAFVWWLWRRC